MQKEFITLTAIVLPFVGIWMESSNHVGVCHAGKQLTCIFSLKEAAGLLTHELRVVYVPHTGCSLN